MATISAKMSWVEGDRFEGTGVYGNTITIDTPKAAGGTEQGFKPTELLLWGMAGCTGIDVVRILRKQRQEISSLEIEVIGHHQDEYPKPFHTVEIKYIASGKDLSEKKLAKAIELSEEKYCMVSQTVARETKVVTSYEVLAD
ncbi:MAG: OsmC family protein [bacterium]|nr:OsmC family protein [bacterium]